MRTLATLLFCFLFPAVAVSQDAGGGWLGVQLKDLTKEEADLLGWEAPRGAKLVKPIPTGPAEAAGLLPDDILVSLDGLEIENVKSFVETVNKKAAGTEIRLAIVRAGKEKRFSLKIGARPAQFAAAKPPVERPLPMLDTGGHMAVIRGLTFTPDGKQLVSGAEDKIIRVWDAATGKTLRTIRGEAGPGGTGKIYAIALSPDGKWLAAGGWTHPECGGRCGEIRLYDFASGKLIALLKGHSNAVLGIAFSPNGRYLISGSEKSALIWDTGSWSGQQVTEAKPLHRLQGHKDSVYAVGFTPDSERAVTGSFDHDLKLWRVADGALLQTMSGHADAVRGLAIAPDGNIASGDRAGEIRLWDGKTGAPIRTVAQQKTGVGSLSFSPDGKFLLTSCMQRHPCQDHVWDTDTGAEIANHKIDEDIVLATSISPDGQWAATAGGHNKEIHIWNLRTGARRLGKDGKPLTLGGTGRVIWAAGFSADNREIGWGTLWQSHSSLAKNPLQQALTLPGLNAPLISPQALDPTVAANFVRAITSQGGWTLNHRKGGNFGDDTILDISEAGKVRASVERNNTTGFDHRSYSFTPDGETVVSGGSAGVITVYSRDGKRLGDFVGHDGDVWAVVPSPDGRFLLSGSDDQTVRLWNLQSRELLVTLFQGTDGEWVMWTPQGFYAASGPGAGLIGWQINHGSEHEADYVTAAQLRRHLNRPDIVARAIQLASAEAAVNEAHGADFTLADLLDKPVPRLRILSPAADATVRGGHAQVTVNLEPTPDPVKLIRIQVNGRQILEKQPAEGAGFMPGRLTFDLPLAKGANKIAIAAVNDTGETVLSLSLNHEGEGELDKRGTLYILAIGVDDYRGLGNSCGDDGKTSCDLRFAGADAVAFAEAMEKSVGRLHEKIVKRVLVNGGRPDNAPTAANIEDALGLLRNTQKNDTVMLFVSGHGINEGPNYRFVPTDAAWAADGFLQPRTVVPWFAFQEALTSAAGRRVLFLDTCHSGNAFNQRLLSDSYEANIVVYSSARADQEALEDGTLGSGHGLFTYALVEGVGGAARNEAGEIRAERLRDFLKSKVAALAAKFRRSQEPQYFRARDADNYVLARAQ